MAAGTPTASTPSPPDDGLYAAVTRCHAGLEAVFAGHQEALLLGELAMAGELLDAYRALQRVHIGFEDGQLLRRARQGGFDLRWPVRLYDAEHRKIEGLLDKVTRRLAALPAGDEAALRREVLALLEAERVLKHVCEHHEAREEQDLLPRLDRWLPPAERSALAAAFAADWTAALAGQAALHERARERLDGLRFRRG